MRVTVHDIKAYGGVEVYLHSFKPWDWIVVSGQGYGLFALKLGEAQQVHIGYEAELTQSRA
jgi:Na+-transporting NADH:ubiquinone oxidoreductase subunit NqrF